MGKNVIKNITVSKSYSYPSFVIKKDLNHSNLHNLLFDRIFTEITKDPEKFIRDLEFNMTVEKDFHLDLSPELLELQKKNIKIDNINYPLHYIINLFAVFLLMRDNKINDFNSIIKVHKTQDGYPILSITRKYKDEILKQFRTIEGFLYQYVFGNSLQVQENVPEFENNEIQPDENLPIDNVALENFERDQIRPIQNPTLNVLQSLNRTSNGDIATYTFTVGNDPIRQ